jgi:aspartate/glutamate racemase
VTSSVGAAPRTVQPSAERHVTFIHTVPALAPAFGELATRMLRGIGARHVVDEELFGVATAEPGLAFDRVVTALTKRVDRAVADGADAVVVTCSTLGPATDVVAATRPIPVIRIDRPMARRAVDHRRIGVVATLESNRAASGAIVEQTAAELGRTVHVTDRLCDGAFEALQAGDRARHDAAVRAAVADLAAEVDVVLLAQASMASALDGAAVPVPVLTSPATAVAAVAEVLGEPAASPLPPVRRVGVSQLRIYRIRPGLMADWLPFFSEVLVPLHALVGIPVPAAWVNPDDPDEFVWIRQFESAESVAEQEQEFFSTPARLALGDVRSRWVESLQVRILRSVEPFGATPSL